jgi:hypothetical protein
MMDEGSHDAALNEDFEENLLASQVHEIEDILEVKLQPNLDLNQLVG